VCNLYSITTNQEAIRALFRVVNRYVGNLAPMPGVFPDYPAPVVRNASAEREHQIETDSGSASGLWLLDDVPERGRQTYPPEGDAGDLDDGRGT
jgi:putative SOS response-associated peptidase YedK